MTQPKSRSDWRLHHGVAFVLLMVCTVFVPPLRRWPWIWVAPLAAYLLLVACVPPLRNSLIWFRVGRVCARTVAATVGIMICTCVALLLFHAIAQPDIRSYRLFLPLDALGETFFAGAGFAIINATLEELVFRGVLFDAVQSQWGKCGSLIGTAALFGLGHLHGYPPGPVGACMAGLYGFVLGALRLWTGGLLLPIAAHIGADATIYSILVNAGPRISVLHAL